VPGRRATAAAAIPNMAIKNTDVIVQAMVRLPLQTTWTLALKAGHANAVAASRRKPTGDRYGGAPLSGCPEVAS
jgi:hypothetical protein